MAIQNRRGIYGDFDPDKMLPGEIAVVTEGDPNTGTGARVYVYVCIKPGQVVPVTTEGLGEVTPEDFASLSERVEALENELGTQTQSLANIVGGVS